MLGLGLLGNLLKPSYPLVRILDAASSISDLTTYTFSGMKLGIPLNSFSIASEFGGTGPLIRSTDKAVIVCTVHGEDAATAFSVSSVTIGGVAGTEAADQGAAIIQVNTAIYVWECSALAGITDTDVVVTWSEAVTGCAVTLLLVSNLIQTSPVADGSSSGINTQTNNNLNAVTRPLVGNSLLIFASTVDDPANVPDFNPLVLGGAVGAGAGNPITLWFEANAEFAYASGFQVIRHTDLSLNQGDYSRTRYNWTGGAGSASNVTILLQ